MKICKEVRCNVMKGLCPKWMPKIITVFLDDIEDDTPQSIIIDMVRADAKEQLIQKGYVHFEINDINNN